MQRRLTLAAGIGIVSLVAVILALPNVARCAPSPEEQAKQILEATGVRGGLVVHLGCADGRLTAALRASEAYLVHGLDADPANVAKARAHIQQKGLYGPVSVDHWTGPALPYADDLVDLVVAEALGPAPMAEVMRVLAPGGVAQVKDGGSWKKTVKPWPDDIDDWTHFLHDASNNAVAQDKRVGPPKRLRWWAGPRWCRSHEFISSFMGMIAGGGRIFYVFDEGLTGVTDSRLPEKWVLLGRDAFNGVLLWKRPLPQWRAGIRWGTSLRGRPACVPRRLVTDGKHLYMTLSHQGPVEVLDPATGKTLRTLAGTETAEELVLAEGTLLVHLAGSGQTRGKPDEAIVAVDAESGRTRWRADVGRYVPTSLAAAAGRAIFNNFKETVCVGLADGKERWRAEAKGGGNQTFILLPDTVLQCTGSAIVARDADTGSERWTTRTGGKSMRSQDVFVSGGCVWHADGDRVAGYDLKTGKVAKTVDPSSIQSPGHHLRCYRAKATERYLLTQWRGVEFVSIQDEPHAQTDWIRGACVYGVMPGNGLLYVPPDPCLCYPGAKVPGLNALAAASDAAPVKAAGERLVKGPAFGQIRKPKLARRSLPAFAAEAATAEWAGEGGSEIRNDEWPTYRHDARRTGSAGCAVSPAVAPAWQADLGGDLTPPVLAGGRVLVAEKDAYVVHAVSAADGKPLWRFTAGGRIDSAPTACGNLVLFGCADGCVYALRATDGVLAWRFRAAPQDRRIVSDSRLESPWPVHGSVLVENGLVYGTAGRSTFLDGGIRLFALDPATGEVRHEARLDTWSRTRQDAEGKPFVPAHHIEGALSDILVAQNGFVYLGMFKFDRALVRQKVPYVMAGDQSESGGIAVKGKPYTAPNENPKRDLEKVQRDWIERTQAGMVARMREAYGGWNLGDRKMGLHLLANFTLLDDSWFNRSFWMYADTWPGFYLAQRGAKTGQLLSVGPEKTYAVQAYPSRDLQSPRFVPGKDGYLLYADLNGTEPVLRDGTRGTPKGWGFTRRVPPVWYDWVPVRVRAMVLAGEHLFVAGPPDVVPEDDPMAAFEGRAGGVLRAVSAGDGRTVAEMKLQAPPVFDGLIAAGGRLYMTTVDGRLMCFAPKAE